MPTPTAVAIELTDEERTRLEAWSRRRTTAQALALRSRIVLAAAAGAATYEIAEQLGVSRPTVTKWRNRFAERRLEGLLDEPRPGRPRTVTDEQVERIVTTTLESTPKDATHWSTRSLAAQLGVSQDAVWRTWQAFSCSRTVRRSSSSRPIRSSWRRSMTSAACTSIRPSERSSCASMRRARSKRWIARDQSCRCSPALLSARPMTTSATAPAASTPLWISRRGKVIGALHERHRAIEFHKFLQTIDREVPAHLAVHLVLDNSSTHKTPKIKRWLAQHPRFVLHFTPTSSSWINLVERWFGELTTKLLRRGAHPTVRALNADIRAWIENWNENPRPYVWTKPAEQILESIARYCQRINQTGH